MKKFFAGALAAVVTTFSASAADLPSRKEAAYAPAPMMVDSFQPFQVRLKATAVIPDGNSTLYDRFGVLRGLGSYGAGFPLFGTGLKVSTAVIPEIDLAYYFNRNFSVETICCITRHDIKGTGFISGTNIGSSWALPATLLFQYHFTNFGAFQPYVGVGPHYTIFLGEKAGSTLSPAYLPVAGLMAPGGVANINLKIKNTFGVAAQVGFDYMINEHWGFNVDLKRYLMRPTAYAVAWNPLVGAIPIRANVHIDPWVASAGLTYRFGGGSTGGVVAKY
ncbi:MAG: OmpW family protein [Hyphomicrobiales bacterium]|nr:OmpW family protein [Hyphomicrobiales bacterium]